MASHPMQPRAGADELARGQAAQALAQLDWRADHQGLELTDRRDAGKHRGASGRHQHAQCLPGTAGSGTSQVLAAKRLAGGTDRIEPVILGAVFARWPTRAIDLDHNLALPGKRDGKRCAIGTGLLDRPEPSAGRMGVSDVDQPADAGRIGGVCGLHPHASVIIDDGDRVGALVGIDPDYKLEPFCESHGVVFLRCGRAPRGRRRPGWSTERQDCDGSRQRRTGF
jgi:hypothetical protein